MTAVTNNLSDLNNVNKLINTQVDKIFNQPNKCYLYLVINERVNPVNNPTHPTLFFIMKS